jgi:hypothetical protein
MRAEGAVSPDLAALPRAALGAAVLATLVVVAALLPFTHPLGDDFCNAVAAGERGVLGAVGHEYRHWGGRWAGHVVVVGLPALADPARVYPIALGAVLLVNLLALRALLGAVPPFGASPRRAWTWALVLFALQLAGLPAPGQTVYWFEGAAVYSLNVSLALLVVAGLLRLPSAPSPRRAAKAGGLAALALVTAAFHELFAALLVAVLGAGAVLAWAARDPRRSAWAAAAVAAGAGLASVLLSPGNDVRGPIVNPGGSDPGAALGALAAMWLRVLDAPGAGDPIGLHTPLGWIVDARLLAASVLLAASAPPAPGWLRRSPRLWRLLAPAGTVALLSAAFLAGGLALGRTLPLRAFDGLYPLFLLGWFLTVFVHVRGGGDAEVGPALRRLGAASALILALGLLVSGTVKHGMRDLVRGRAAAFDRAMEARYAEARRVREAGGGELVLSPIEPWPSSFFRNDLDSVSPELHACAARWFGVESVRLSERAAQRGAGRARRSTSSPE